MGASAVIDLAQAQRWAERRDNPKPARMPSGDRTKVSSGEGLH